MRRIDFIPGILIVAIWLCFPSKQVRMQGVMDKDDKYSPVKECVGLAHFPAHNIGNLPRIASKYKDKREYFENYLKGTMNIFQGRQMNKETDLCLIAENDATLLPASCISQAGYSFVVFVGDSMAREAAWSLRQLAESNINEEQCQPWASSFDGNTKADPSFLCNSTELSCKGGVKPINGVPPLCCEHPFVLHRTDFMLDKIFQLVGELNTNCNCSGIVYMQSAIHPMLANKYGSSLGRQAYTSNLLSSLLSNNPRNHTYIWASPPALDLITMALSPEKPDRRKFDSETSDFWRWQDLYAIANLSDSISGRLIYSEQFEVSSSYLGLSCDGMHFGKSYEREMFGCHGMSVVTDVLTQLWLHRLTWPKEKPLRIC